MADEREEEREGKRRKKKKEESSRKLVPGDWVEELYFNEELGWCWREEEIAVPTKFIAQLDDDNCSEVVEGTRLSDAAEANSRTTRRGYHRARPRPPPDVIQLSDIRYGLCVDASFGDSWLEGVVFDHEEGSKTRLIFFPGPGNQEKVTVDRLRRTLQWNEYSGQWKARGDWVFLKVVESFEKQDALPASVSQIWACLKSTEAFQKGIEVWSSGSHATWCNLVLGVIEELQSRASKVNAVSSQGVRKPVNLPAAITEYKAYVESQKANKHKPSNVDVRLLRSRAKEHLRKSGWDLWMKDKGTKEELRYTSPDRRVYISLYTACKAYLESLGPSVTSNNQETEKSKLQTFKGQDGTGSSFSPRMLRSRKKP